MTSVETSMILADSRINKMVMLSHVRDNVKYNSARLKCDHWSLNFDISKELLVVVRISVHRVLNVHAVPSGRCCSLPVRILTRQHP